MTRDRSSRFGKGREIQRSALATMRPMKPGELIDRGLRVYQRNAAMVLRNSAFPALICVAAFAILDNFVLPLAFTSQTGAKDSEQAMNASIAAILAVVVGGPLYMTGAAWITGLSSRIALATLCGRDIDEDEVVEATRSNLSVLVRTLSLSSLKASSIIIVSTALILLSGFLTGRPGVDPSLPGTLIILGTIGDIVGLLVWCFIRMRESLVIPIVCFEEIVGPKSAAKRSASLLKGNRYHAAGLDAASNSAGLMLIVMLLFLGSIYAAATLVGIQGFVESLIGPGPIRSLVNTCLDILPVYFAVLMLLPAWGSILSTIYFDRCIRLEGLDIETLAAISDREKVGRVA